MSNAVVTLIVLAVAAFFCVTGLLPPAVTAMAGAVAVGILGIIPMSQVFAGLSNSTAVMFASMRHRTVRSKQPVCLLSASWSGHLHGSANKSLEQYGQSGVSLPPNVDETQTNLVLSFT